MKILKGVARFLYYIFSIYQFSVPVCFLDEADYDLSGNFLISGRDSRLKIKFVSYFFLLLLLFRFERFN